jgi:hypothetical protein
LFSALLLYSFLLLDVFFPSGKGIGLLVLGRRVVLYLEVVIREEFSLLSLSSRKALLYYKVFKGFIVRVNF